MKAVALAIEGMSCASCARKVEEALRGVAGVESAHVDMLTRRARVILRDAGTPVDALIEAVRAAGYSARELPSESAVAAAERRAARRGLIRTGLIGMLLLAGGLAGHFHFGPRLAADALVVVALVLAAYPTARRAVASLRRLELDAAVLVTIAVVAAAALGEFVAAGEVAFIMLLGGQLEDYTARRARQSLGNLLSLVPPTARVRRGESEVEVPAATVAVGDVVVVRAGERIPVDGRVLQGNATINQAAVTGESVPVEKRPGDEVYVGTLNESGALWIEATRVGADTTLARVAELVQSAQQRTAPIHRTLDRWARWLVPVMLVLAAAVWLITHDLHRAITVLIVACPCALVLASPTAVIAAIARAARAGVLIKGGEHVEAAARLHTIVFDKTGTLTAGEPEVTHLHRFCEEHSEAELVKLAAVAEKMSSHPVARAILRKADRLGLKAADPAEFTVHHGRGVEAQHNGQQLLVGQSTWLAERSVPVSPAVAAHMEAHHAEGHTTVAVAHDGKVCGTICVADTVRAQADDALRQLRAQGIERVVMLTGDNRRVALQIAGKLGIDEVLAEVLPAQKAAHIEALRNGPRGAGVAMVGDGVNDAPALAVADVGIAMGVTGTDVAHEAADIALLADDLSKIAFAVQLCRKAVRIIRQGLWFALIYNVVMVSTAASGHLGMVGGALAHQLSSLLVILNAMRLLR